MKNKSVLSKEAAREQVEIFCDYYDLAEEFITPNNKPYYNTLKAALSKEIQRGRIEIEEKNDELVVTQNLVKPVQGYENFEYKEISAAAKVAMGKAEGNSQDGILHLMAALANVNYTVLHRLKGVDMSALETVANLFLLV
jgi:hypothetical protein